MSISYEIVEIQTIVEKLLREDAKYRDCDRKLSARIWAIQLGGLESLHHVSAYDFLCEYVGDDSPLCSQESIGRARRKIQEIFPELRGQKYNDRKEEQSAVKSVLGYKA
jgi:hypothetical protein